MGRMNIKVSVILPSLNVANYISECIDSVISQSLQELEIICVDSGSTDGTVEIINNYAKQDARIRVINSDKKSYGRQVNLGLEYAQGKYVAIVETDDFIAPDMYQCLYDYAKCDELDYAAADFDIFYRFQSGRYYFIRQHLFDIRVQDWYEKVLDSNQIATLRASDYVLWKGIYNRKFLNRNHIRLHESPSAAFQDMGSLQQVKTYAKKAKYIDKSFYRYRQDREEASSKGLDGLQFYKEEFLWINNELNLISVLNDIHKKYYYLTMSISFLTKYEQILLKLNGNWRDKKLCEPYLWFLKQVADKIDNGILEKNLYEQELWMRLLLLMDSQEVHAQFLLNKEKNKEQCIQEFLYLIKDRSVVIFGCGIRGERLMCFCDKHKIKIHGFCDNNIILQGETKFGYPIFSPFNVKDQLKENNLIFLLTMKAGFDQVFRQLMELGVESDRIIEKIPEGIL